MKVLTNIITPEQIAEVQKTYPNFRGVVTINGQQFIPGQWVHVADNFVLSGLGSAFIKNVRWVLAARVRQILRENDLHNFARGVKELAELYGEKMPELAGTILQLSPEAEIPE